MARFLAMAVAGGLALAGCEVHLVGDSTAWQVGLVVEEYEGSTLTAWGCGYTERPEGTYRVLPDGSWGYEPCLLDWGDISAMDPGDHIVAMVSIHDAYCEAPVPTPGPGVADCSYSTEGYAAAHAAWTSAGKDVIWVAVPPLAEDSNDVLHPHAVQMNARLSQLNAEIEMLLDCQLVGHEVRSDPDDNGAALFSDGLHYTTNGALVVAGRVGLLDPAVVAC